MVAAAAAPWTIKSSSSSRIGCTMISREKSRLLQGIVSESKKLWIGYAFFSFLLSLHRFFLLACMGAFECLFAFFLLLLLFVYIHTIFLLIFFISFVFILFYFRGNCLDCAFDISFHEIWLNKQRSESIFVFIHILSIYRNTNTLSYTNKYWKDMHTHTHIHEFNRMKRRKSLFFGALESNGK